MRGTNNEPVNVVRVCGAILRNDRILMVFHQSAARSYWTLPGGSVEPGETPEQAVVREVKEETGLDARAPSFLFDEPFAGGVCRCFLLNSDLAQEAALGYDPEETHLPAADRLLQGVAWHPLDSKKGDGQVSKVIACLPALSPKAPL